MVFRRSPDLRDSIVAYIRRARILRQIQSNKANRADKLDRVYLIVTVVVATIVSVIGFAGTDRIAALLGGESQGESLRPFVEAVFNVAVLLVLVATLVGLVFRFGEHANRHYRSLEVLTDFMRDCTDQVALHDGRMLRIRPRDLDIVRTRYKGILATLPPSSDKEYAKAKTDDANKRQLSSGEPGASPEIVPKSSGNRVATPELLPRHKRSRDNLLAVRQVAGILTADETRMAALRALRSELGSSAWIAGGFVREAIWDSISGRSSTPPRDDVDVIYFDRRDTSKDAERALQERLVKRAPAVRWSVKNQARMHLVNGDEPYKSLEDAVAHFPETASAVAVQTGRSRLTVLAPIGLKDLVELRVRKTPIASESSFRRRRAQVASSGRWPLLDVVD